MAGRGRGRGRHFQPQIDDISPSPGSTNTPPSYLDWSQVGRLAPGFQRRTDDFSLIPRSTNTSLSSPDWSQLGRLRRPGVHTSIISSESVHITGSDVTGTFSQEGQAPQSVQVITDSGVTPTLSQEEEAGQSIQSTNSITNKVTTETGWLSNSHCQSFHGLRPFEPQTDMERNFGIPRTPYPPHLPHFYDTLVNEASKHCQDFADKQDDDARVLMDEQWYLKGEEDWSVNIGRTPTANIQPKEPSVGLPVTLDDCEDPIHGMTAEEKHIKEIKAKKATGNKIKRWKKAEAKKQAHFDYRNDELQKDGEEMMPLSQRPCNPKAHEPYQKMLEEARSEFLSLNLASSSNYVPDFLGDFDDVNLASGFTVDPKERSKYKAPETVNLIDDDNLCLICREEIVGTTLALIDCPACKTVFHQKCISTWLAGKKKCPICREIWPTS